MRSCNFNFNLNHLFYLLNPTLLRSNVFKLKLIKSNWIVFTKISGISITSSLQSSAKGGKELNFLIFTSYKTHI